jgi:uncharacterized protein (DUF169 family)
MSYGDVATRITERLQLDTPPVALAFANEPPAGVPTTEAPVPSACTYWRQAESAVFFAPADEHMNCPIGAMTMGFALTEQAQQELGTLVGNMFEIGYLSDTEPEHLPTVQRGAKGIVYGPLSEFPIPADLVVMWLTPKQAMIFNEAVGSAQWSGGSPSTVFGRPTCSALAVADQRGAPTLSFGCAGMRTFVQLREDRLLVSVPGSQLTEFAAGVDKAVEANRTMDAAYQEQRGKFVTA